ncbi:MAG: cytochrome-c peroxidase [Proteobacteria bacterium]|nr:cytochrome-c peroxidase [Pseudomonadota bacterium]MBS0573248.1 cytochrome-c peroxidase [Pseudomonadota bacterium]
MRLRLTLIAAILLLCPGATRPPGLPGPVTDEDYRPVDQAEARLGRLLFYDRILSGNRNIACATCHNPAFATGDGLSLGLGEGAVGLGPARHVAPEDMPEQRIPRNTPPLFNLGARDVTLLFDDGRIAEDASRPSGLRTPLDDSLVTGFHSVLAAQPMFPILSPDEMAGHNLENDVSAAVHEGLITVPGGALDILAGRVAAIPAYRQAFAAINPAIAAGRKIAFADIANALAAFVSLEWRADRSPFDAFLRGQAPLPPDAEAGMRLFYGPAGCSACHSGKFQTDQKFHAMGEPQFGPGEAGRFETNSRDLGRMRVTHDPADAYAFRTPSLRNVTATGPWGHTGAFSDLAKFLGHHTHPATGMEGYDIANATLPAFPEAKKDDLQILKSPDDVAAIAAAARGQPSVNLTAGETAEIIAFLASLRDRASIGGRLGVPDEVPSGLPVDRK